MKTEYKEVYNLVNSFNFNCDYIKNNYGFYSLNLFSKDYSIFKGLKYKINASSLEDLKTQIKEVLK